MILHANAALSRRQRERLVSLVAGALTITAAAVLVGPRSPAGTPSSVPVSQCVSCEEPRTPPAAGSAGQNGPVEGPADASQNPHDYWDRTWPNATSKVSRASGRGAAGRPQHRGLAGQLLRRRSDEATRAGRGRGASRNRPLQHGRRGRSAACGTCGALVDWSAETARERNDVTTPVTVAPRKRGSGPARVDYYAVTKTYAG